MANEITQTLDTNGLLYLGACLQLCIICKAQQGQNQVLWGLNNGVSSFSILQLATAVTLVLVITLHALGTQVVIQKLTQTHCLA